MTKELVRQKFVKGELTPQEFLRQLSELLCQELRMNGEQQEFEFEFLAESHEPDIIRCRGVLRKRQEVSREICGND